MKNNKIIQAMVLILLTLIAIFPVQSFAAGKIDPEQTVSLTVSYQHENTPLSGVEFKIYHVATVDEYGKLQTTADFKQYPVNITGENAASWSVLASTLEGYVYRDNIAAAASGKTNEQGILRFPTGEQALEQGLYLVIGAPHEQDGMRYKTVPFMVMLPESDLVSNEWQYEKTAYPKSEESKITDNKTVTYSVKKVWRDTGYEKSRPKEIVIQLLRDGEVWDSAVLKKSNDWSCNWEKLNQNYRWRIVEKEVEGYTVEIVQDGSEFLVINTCTKSDLSVLPQTGQLRWPIPVMTVIGVVLILVGLWYSKSNKSKCI